MIHHRFLLPLLIAMCLAEPAVAQINPFRGSGSTPLNNDDISALTDATNRLLDKPQLATGNTESWSNPGTGASGTVTAGSSTHRKGLACRIMRYKNTVSSHSAARSTTLTWCKTKDGWKIG